MSVKPNTTPPPPSFAAKWQLTKRYFRCLRNYRLRFAAMIVCMLCVAALEPLLPLLMKPLLDGESVGGVVPLGYLPYLMLAIVVASGVFSFCRSYLGGWLDLTMQRDLRARMTARMFDLPLAYFRAESSGKTTSRYMAFVPALTSPTMPVSVALVQETAKTGFYLCAMFYLHWRLTLVMLVVAPLTIILIRVLSSRMRNVADKAQENTAQCQSKLNETMRQMPVIKIAGANAAAGKLGAAFGALRSAGLRIMILLSASQPLSQIIVAVPSAVVLFYVIDEMQAGEITKGTVASFVGIMLLMPRSLRVIPRSVALWAGMMAAAAEVFGFLDAKRERDDGKKTINRAKGDIRFDGVSFAYPNGKVALHNICLHLRAGETMAFVGKSGAGKTTLAQMLPRFAEPQQGVLTIDGIDARQLKLSSLRQQIALVPQDALLFDGSIADNVAYPDDGGAQMERVMRALASADAAAFVAEMPGGASAMVGENGAQLSGGQRQRLALARAFYRDAPIVIMDEATSALDSESENKIKTAMRELLSGRTAIIIAHRFATIEFADRIAVLDDGKLIATGTMPELLKTCPPFAELYRAQKLA